MALSRPWSFVERQVQKARDWVSNHKKTTSASLLGILLAVYSYKKLKPILHELRAHLKAMERVEQQQRELEAKRAQQQLQRNFDDNNRICSVTLSPCLQTLKKQIEETFNIDAIFHQIKQNDISKALKIQLWEKVKTLAICRFFLWLYGCCVSEALASIQFSIIGRYAYAEQRRPPEQTEETMQQFAETNKQYLSRLEHVTTNGFKHLSNLVEECVTEHAQSLNLRSSYSPTDMIETFSKIDRSIMKGLSMVKGDAKLLHCALPENSESPQNELVTCGSGDRLDEMCAETKMVIECDDFDDVMTACYDVAFSHAKDEFLSICASSSKNASHQNGSIQTHKIPLPKMIPLIVRSYSRISKLDEQHQQETQRSQTLVEKISNCPELREIQKIIFFPMDDPGITQAPEKPLDAMS